MEIPSVTILYLAHRRQHFAELTFRLISKCKEKFHLAIGDTTEQASPRLPKLARELSLNFTYRTFPKKGPGLNNYLSKLDFALSFNTKYCIKLDEDVFLNPGLLDFFISNLDQLDNDKHVVLTPALSNGIPSVDYFLNNFSPEERERLHNVFGKTNVPAHFWGADYSGIKTMLKQKGYNPDLYYSQIAKVNHHYKGMHPIRINLEAQRLLNKTILANSNQFLEDREFQIQELDRPYFCNTAFGIRSDVWKKVLGEKKLKSRGGNFVDSFDEVPLNEYRQKHNGAFLCITNAFGIHTMYNTFRDPALAQHLKIAPGKLLKDAYDEEMSFYKSFKKQISKNGQGII